MSRSALALTALVLASSLHPSSPLRMFSPFPNQRFKGRVCLVTGATSGLGLSLVKAIDKRGPAKIILVGRSPEKLESVSKCLKSETSVYVADFADAESVRAAASNIKESEVALSVIVNNAGVSQRSEFGETGMSTFRSVFEVNLFAGAEILHALLPNLSAASYSTGTKSNLIWISSVQAQLALPSRSAYSASKHAVSGLCDSLRAEMSGYCDVCCVEPGYVKTALSLNAVTKDGTKHGHMDASTAQGVDPDGLAEKILDRVEAGASIVTDGQDTKTRVAKWLKFLTPGVLEGIMKGRYEKSKGGVK